MSMSSLRAGTRRHGPPWLLPILGLAACGLPQPLHGGASGNGALGSSTGVPGSGGGGASTTTGASGASGGVQTGNGTAGNSAKPGETVVTAMDGGTPAMTPKMS